MTPSMDPMFAAAAEAPCVHRWRVGRPVENVCSAVCSHCGAMRDYPASTSAPRAGTIVLTRRS